MSKAIKTSEEQKRLIIQAGRKAIDELIKVAEEKIIKPRNEDSEDPGMASDRLKNAAAAKRVAIFDAFEILAKIDSEELMLNQIGDAKEETKGGFAEQRAKRQQKTSI
jgi:hypothetical protein